MINWKVRIKNKTFWLALIPALLLFIQSFAALFGYQMDVTETNQRLLAVVEALFTVLSILGIVVDPTTAGISDSERALTYERPHKD
jgi:phi LC3 family holin